MRTRRLAWTITITALLVLAGILSYSMMRGFGAQVFPGILRPSDSRVGLALSGQRTLSCEASLNVSQDPAGAAPTLAVEVTLTVESTADSRDTFCFLLNQGLRIEEVAVDNERARWSRSGNLLRVTCTDEVAPGERATVHLQYGGVPDASAYEQGWIAQDGVCLPMLSLWLPLDLSSFFLFRCQATLPDDWVPVVAGDVQTMDTEDGRKTFAWEVKRPILGASFAAGNYAVQERTHGAVRCKLFMTDDAEVDTSSILDTVGSSYSYLRALYGSDGFDTMTILVDPRVSAPCNGCNSVVMLPETLPADSREQFTYLAREVARNWWGATVTGRWFPQQPEAATWLIDGFAEYSAWVALRGLKGRDAFLRFIETRQCPPSIDFPMKTISMPDRYQQAIPGTAADPGYRLVRQAYTVSVIHDRMGRQRFEGALANLLKIHRYTALSYAAILQEMELAGEVDLREFFRLWFERAGTFDYSVADVLQDGESLRVKLDNPGDIPFQGKVVIALVSGATVSTHEFDAGPDGGSFLVPVSSPVERVILDPEFRTPDMLRANNIWPRTRWPRNVSASPSGQLAIAAAEEWCEEGANLLATTADEAGSFLRVDLPGALAATPLWSRDGRLLLAVGESSFVWSNETGVRAVEASSLMPAGWIRDGLLFASRQPPGSWWIVKVGERPVRVAACSTVPTALSARADKEYGRVAYIDSDRRVLVESLNAKDAKSIVLGRAANGNVAWTAASDAVVFMTESNELVRCPADGSPSESLLQLSHPVTHYEVASDATYVAWTSFDHRLRCCAISPPMPIEVPLPGEPVAFSWGNDDTLIVLAAETLPDLPLRCYGRNSLWRYTPATKALERIAIDLTRVF
ncbi:MAG: hypothetical protein IT365_14850 [Candidatus Hydrogenedentes bacterium]|nr:hypothetical protein [Candidatus Hydrogenedentota bacterium]